MIDKLEYKSGASVVVAEIDYDYEDYRDLLKFVENKDIDGSTTVSKYDYSQGSGNDALGQRTSVVNSGSVWGTGNEELNDYTYNDRSELTLSERRAGTTPGSGTEVTGERRTYSYDNIGKRETSLHGDTSANTLYYCANILDQYDDIYVTFR